MQTTIKGLLTHMMMKERSIRGMLEYLVVTEMAVVVSRKKGPMGRPVDVYDINPRAVELLRLKGEVL